MSSRIFQRSKADLLSLLVAISAMALLAACEQAQARGRRSRVQAGDTASSSGACELCRDDDSCGQPDDP